MSQLESDSAKALGIIVCPTCGLELADDNAICACDPNFALPEAVDPMIGQTLGCYKIIEVVGRGGMGVIYKAHDQWMDRTIAIKMLHGHLVHDPQSQQRFNQEAKAAGNIENPNVIQAYDFGVVPSTQQPFLVMEYLEGKSLSQVIESGQILQPERAVSVFIQAASALKAAHAKNVLHRDLKPSNIMLIQTNEQPDFVKIVDFGIAKLLPASGKDVQLTQTGEVFGSPLYMSPEQFAGRSLDVRSDIYSLGCVMYEALTGKPPLAGDHVLETMYQHMNKKPKRFSELRPDLKISPKIEAIVMRALEKQPDQRYQTMSELCDDLELARSGFRDRRPLAVKCKSALAHLRRIRKRYDVVAGKALLVVLSMIISASAVLLTADYLRVRHQHQWQQLCDDAQTFYEREDFAHAAEKLKEAVKVAQADFGEDDPHYLETLKRLAWVYNANQEYAKGRKLFEKVYKLSEEELERIKIAQAMLAGGPLLDEIMQGGSTEGPEQVLRRASETIEKYLGSNDPELIPLLEQLALVYQSQGNFKDADDLYEQIFSIMNDTEGENSVGAAYANKLLGGLQWTWATHLKAACNPAESEERFKQAKSHFEMAYNQYKLQLGADSPQAQEAMLLMQGKKQPDNLVKHLQDSGDRSIPNF